MVNALIISHRDFILSWYSKITNDKTFVDEVIKVIAHTTRSLEQRLRQIDLEILLLDELPSLLDNHVRGKIGSHKSHPTVVIAYTNFIRLPAVCLPSQDRIMSTSFDSRDFS